jgi:hypothetical protein
MEPVPLLGRRRIDLDRLSWELGAEKEQTEGRLLVAVF